MKLKSRSQKLGIVCALVEQVEGLKQKMKKKRKSKKEKGSFSLEGVTHRRVCFASKLS